MKAVPHQEEQHRILNENAALQRQEFAAMENQLRQVQNSVTQVNAERRVVRYAYQM